MQGGVGTKVTIVIGISPAIPDRDLLGTMVAFTSPQGGMALSKAAYTPNGEPASEMTFVTSVPSTAANGPLTVGITPSDSTTGTIFVKSPTSFQVGGGTPPTPTPKLIWVSVEPAEAPIGSQVTVTVDLDPPVTKSTLDWVSVVFNSYNEDGFAFEEEIEISLTGDPVTRMTLRSRVPEEAVTGHIRVQLGLDSGDLLETRSTTPFRVGPGGSTVTPPPATSGCQGDCPLLIGDLTGSPGATVMAELKATAVVRDLAAIQLDIDVSPPAGSPGLTVGDKVEAGPLLEGANLAVNLSATGARIVAVVSAGKAGPGVVLRIPILVPKAAVVGARYQVNLSGTISDSLGHEQSNVFQSGWLTVTQDISKGDVNGDSKISVADVVLLLRVVAGLDPSTPTKLTGGDMDGNGKLTVADVVKLLRIIAGLDKGA
jgi:hypothetical protein